MKSISEVVTFIVGLSVFIERVNELLLDAIIASVPFLSAMSKRQPKTYTIIKCRLAIVVSLVMGVAASVAVSGTGALPDSISIPMYVILGLTAGALAPYSHNLLQLMTNVQRLTNAQTPQSDNTITPSSSAQAPSAK